MKRLLPLLLALALVPAVAAQTVTRNLRYRDDGHPRHVLDVHAPAAAKSLPVVFWIHGGGWTTGDKSEVAEKPRAFMARGFVFVSTNYRLLPSVDMATLTNDVADALAWVHGHIAEYGGDPTRVLVMGHSAGAQLAALLCTDDRYLNKRHVPFSILKGCVPLDADTYDLPAIIESGEIRRLLHGQPLPQFGRREKFGNDPAKHRDFSAVAHVAKGKGIPPFLLLHVSENADTAAQAFRLATVLKGAGVAAKVVAVRDTTHNRLNDNLGVSGDPATKELDEFIARALKP